MEKLCGLLQKKIIFEAKKKIIFDVYIFFSLNINN